MKPLKWDELVSGLKMSRSEARSAARLVLADSHDAAGFSLGDVMVMLLCDFLSQLSMRMEVYSEMVLPFVDGIRRYGAALERDLDAYVPGKCGSRLRACFFSIADNRYSSLCCDDPRVEPVVWDCVEGRRVKAPGMLPIMDVVISIPALYLRGIAMKTGHGDAALAFRRGGVAVAEERDDERIEGTSQKL